MMVYLRCIKCGEHRFELVTGRCHEMKGVNNKYVLLLQNIWECKNCGTLQKTCKEKEAIRFPVDI